MKLRIVSSLLLIAISLTSIYQTPLANTESNLKLNKDLATSTNALKSKGDCDYNDYVTGFFSLNNNNQNVDYKITKEDFKYIASKYICDGILETRCEENTLRNMSYLQSEKSYLIENDIISREIGFYEKNGLMYAFQANKDRDLMSKTDLLVSLYKTVYGVIESRPVVFKTSPTRGNTRVSFVSAYITAIGDIVNAMFNDDMYLYVSPNVYELYLTEMLNKGIIDIRDLENKQFRDEYLRLQNGKKPIWYNKQSMTGNVKALGQTFSEPKEGYKAYQTDVKYLKDEYITTIDALHLVEEFMRKTEKDMSRTEADIVLYKYGLSYLEGLADYDKDTLTFLIAKGVLNYENQNEFINYYSDFTYDLAYKILYRVKNKDARLDFSQIQLTDSESFWQARGFASDNIQIYEERYIPFKKVFHEGETALEFLNDKDDSIDILPDYDDLFASMFGIFNVHAAVKDKNITVEYLLEDGYSYEYDGKKLEFGTTPTEVADLKDTVTKKKYNDIDLLFVKFSINSTNKESAIAMIESKLKILDLDKLSNKQAVSVTKVSDGSSTSLISENSISSLSELFLVDDVTIMNVRTGVIGVLFPKQKFAVIGNKVIKNDFIMVKGAECNYYNLDVISTLMSNAEVKKINGAKSLVTQSMDSEEVLPVKSTTGSVLGKVLTANFTYKEDITSDVSLITKNTTKRYYNLDHLVNGTSTLNRTFKNAIKTKEGKKTDITLIVDWDFIVPSGAGRLSDYVNKNETGKLGNITYKDANTILSERPENKALQFWWDRNIGMSNALANFIYGTKNVNYVTNGYLVPSVTVLVSGECGRDKLYMDGQSYVEEGSLSDSQLNEFFKDFTVTLDYSKKFLDGKSTKDWWKYYYRSGTNDVVTNELIRNATFKCLKPTEIKFKSKKKTLVDCLKYDNFILTKNNCIYKESDGRVSVDNSAVNVYSKIDNNMYIPSAGVTRFSIGTGTNKVSFRYNGTVNKNGKTYYKLTVYNNSTKYKFKGSKDNITDMNYYISNSGNSLLAYEKSIYDKFGGSLLKSFSKHERFSIDQRSDSYADGCYYMSIVKGGKKHYAQLYLYENGIFKKKQIDDFLLKKNLIGLSMGLNIYLPQTEFYFCKDSNKSIKLRKGTSLFVLNASRYFSSPNNLIIDKALSNASGAIDVNKLKDGNLLVIGENTFKRTDSKFVANIKDIDNILPVFLESVESNNVSNQKSCLLKTVGIKNITAGSRQLPIQSYIADINIGLDSKIDDVLYRDGARYYFVNKGKSIEASKTRYPGSLCLSLELSGLRCRPIDKSGNVYTLLIYSSEYGSNGMHDVPFYMEGSSINNRKDFNFDISTYKYQLSKYVNEIHAKIVNDYDKALQGDIITLGKMVIVAVTSYLIIATWVGYLILRSGVGMKILEAVAMPSYNRTNKGVDILKLFTLGVMSIDDDTNLVRIVLMDLAFTIIIYIIIFRL